MFVSVICTKECILTFSSKVHPSVRIPAKTFVISKVTGNLSSSNFDISCFNSLLDIPLADSEFYRNSKIDMLIGCELLPSIMSSGIRTNICGSLLAQKTVFGWILTGPVLNKSISSFSATTSLGDEQSLEKSITRFCEVEEPPKKAILSDDDRYCED